LSLSGIPEVTDEAKEDPELAVLSAMAHARDPDTEKSTRIALLAQNASLGLDADRSKLYCDLVLNSLPEAARRALQTMGTSKYEYQSDFARRYVGQGMADVVIKVLESRFGELPLTLETHIRDATIGATIPELRGLCDRLLSAQSLAEVVKAL
jgi:uncharacterized protein with von Willebrand factor type A (vWA) domain